MNIIDGFTFGEQETDMGYARVPNGTGNFMIQYSTFAYNNDLSSSQYEFNDSNKKVIKKVDILGRDIKNIKGTPLFYIYDDGSVEKIINY